MEIVEPFLRWVIFSLLRDNHLGRCHFHSSVRVGHRVDGRCLHHGGLCHVGWKLQSRADDGFPLLAPSQVDNKHEGGAAASADQNDDDAQQKDDDRSDGGFFFLCRILGVLELCVMSFLG